eukprot:225063-Amphidinium_carterae.1
MERATRVCGSRLRSESKLFNTMIHNVGNVACQTRLWLQAIMGVDRTCVLPITTMYRNGSDTPLSLRRISVGIFPK